MGMNVNICGLLGQKGYIWGSHVHIGSLCLFLGKKGKISGLLVEVDYV